MAVFGKAVATCILLIRKYPEGYTLEELHGELAVTTTLLTCFDVEWVARTLLGMEDGQPHSLAMIACWKQGADQRIYFDPEVPVYSHYDDGRFRKAVEGWIAGEKARKRELNQGD